MGEFILKNVGRKIPKFNGYGNKIGYEYRDDWKVINNETNKVEIRVREEFIPDLSKSPDVIFAKDRKPLYIEHELFMLDELICILKNLGDIDNFTKQRIQKICSQLIHQISYGNMYIFPRRVSPYFGIACTEEWKNYANIPKDYDGKDPLSNTIYVETKPKKRVKTKRNPISGRVRQNVLMRDNYSCQICGATTKDGAKLEIDHIIPISKGGGNNENNLQVLCRQCNREKHNRNDLLHDKMKLKELKSTIYE